MVVLYGVVFAVALVTSPSYGVSAAVTSEDGYVNVRNGRGVDYSIIGRAYSDEAVEVIDNSGTWYRVETRNGIVGYAHKSGLILERNASGPLKNQQTKARFNKSDVLS